MWSLERLEDCRLDEPHRIFCPIQISRQALDQFAQAQVSNRKLIVKHNTKNLSHNAIQRNFSHAIQMKGAEKPQAEDPGVGSICGGELGTAE